MLDQTLVVWGGEFGRTPMSEKGDGRDHNPYGFTMWMAGGGVKAGITIGRTDEVGLHAVEDRLHVHDLHATILHCLGVDHTQLIYRHKAAPNDPRSTRGRFVASCWLESGGGQWAVASKIVPVCHLRFAIWQSGISMFIDFGAVCGTRVVRSHAMNLVGSRFQFSLRTLLLVTAAIALLLVPVAWITRERMQMMRAQEAVLQAREVALRSVVREGQRLPRQSQGMEQFGARMRI